MKFDPFTGKLGGVTSSQREKNYQRQFNRWINYRNNNVPTSVLNPLGKVPSFGPTLLVAIDHWIDHGGEANPAIGILMGNPETEWYKPWALWPRAVDTNMRVIETVPVRGDLLADTYTICYNADTPISVWWEKQTSASPFKASSKITMNGIVVRHFYSYTSPKERRKQFKRTCKNPQKWASYHISIKALAAWRLHNQQQIKYGTDHNTDNLFYTPIKL